jgi:hypothetical protein
MAAAGSGSGSAPAAELAVTQAEIDEAKGFLRQARDEIAAATEGLSETQWNFKPAPERWSIAQIVEHVAMTHSVILGPVRQNLAAAPAPPGDRDHKRVDSIIVNGFPDRSARFKGPDALQPTGRWTPAASLEALSEGTAGLIAYLEGTPDLRQHAVEALPIKAISNGEYTSMDGYQWILAAAGHAARHFRQILEVKADPTFPAR